MVTNFYIFKPFFSVKCEICGSYEFTRRCPYCGKYFCYEHMNPIEHFCERRRRSILSYGFNNIVILLCTILFFSSLLFRLELIKLFALNPTDLMPWQPLTCIFLHVDFWHFFINMFVLFFFGGELENRLGTNRYLKVFLLSGLIGSFGYLAYAYSLNISSPALGASAAIFGVFGCLALIAPEMKIFIFPIPIPIGVRTALMIFLIYEIWMMLLNTLHVFETNVANVAHLAGLLVGLYYGKKFRKRRIRID